MAIVCTRENTCTLLTALANNFTALQFLFVFHLIIVHFLFIQFKFILLLISIRSARLFAVFLLPFLCNLSHLSLSFARVPCDDGEIKKKFSRCVFIRSSLKGKTSVKTF